MSRGACLTTIIAAAGTLVLAGQATAGDWTVRDAAPTAVNSVTWAQGAPELNASLASLDRSPLLGGDTVPGADGVYGIQSSDTWISATDGGVDHIRITTAARLIDPTRRPEAFGGSAEAGSVDRYDVSYIRGWPSAFAGRSGRYAFDVTPHAGLGVTDIGGSAEAGATLRIGQAGDSDDDDGLGRFHVQDGSVFGQQGRWYLFAAASGRAVGYNFLRGEDGWKRSGVSTDSASFVGDTQAGLALRKGPMQASFGWVHREVKAHGVRNFDTSRDEDLVAFTFSLKPRH